MWSHLPVLAFMAMRDLWHASWDHPGFWQAAMIDAPWHVPIAAKMIEIVGREAS